MSARAAPRDPVDAAEALLAQGKAEEALALLQPLADGPAPDHPVLATCATVLKALDRPMEALPYNEEAARRFPASPVAWHNLAATLGDLGRGQAASAAVGKAFALGLDGAATWSVSARAAVAAGDLDRAEQAYRESVRRAPGDVDIATEFANFVWMRRGDAAEADSVLDACFHGGGAPAPLAIAKARLREVAGENEAAANFLAAAAQRLPDDAGLLIVAAHAALETGRVDEAEALTRRALALAPERTDVLNQLAIVELARGRPEQALATARRGLAIAPENQSLLAWGAMAARQLGDPLYRELYDYERMVAAYTIETPPGWATLDAYLADLAETLRPMHRYQRPPFQQSVRHGSQSLQPMVGSDAPALKAFFEAIEAPLHQHIASLGQGTDPLRRRIRGGYSIKGAWSILLGTGGFHTDHFHPQGWLSCAFYVQTPQAAAAGQDHAGWIRFGQPPLALTPPLPAEHFVQPQPGRLVVFPSYMWHGTVPFGTDEQRLTISFDAAPAPLRPRAARR